MKRLITYLSKLCSPLLGLQSSEVGSRSEEATIEQPLSNHSAPFGSRRRPAGGIQSITTSLVTVLCLLVTLSVGSAWGADETLTITGTAVTWGTGSGYKTGTGTLATDVSTNIGLSWTDTYNNSGIQMRKSSGLLYSTSYPSTNNKIKSIKITNSTNSAQLTCSTDGSTWSSAISYTSGTAKDVSSSGYKYFKVVPTSGAFCLLSSIVVVYTTGTPAVKHTVTWKVNGTTSSTSEVNEGSKPTFPSTPVSCDGTSTTFIGWTQTPWSGKIDDISGLTTDATKVYISASQMPDVAADVTYHAVFAKGGANTYVKGTKSNLTSGQTVLIVNTANNVAMKGESSAKGALPVTISSNTITTTDTYVLWTVEPHGSGYYFKYGTDYLNSYSGSLYIDTWTDEWSVSGSGPYVLSSSEDSGSKLKYNGSSAFTVGTGSDATYNMDFFIPATPTDYLTNCCTALGSINGSFFVRNTQTIISFSLTHII